MTRRDRAEVLEALAANLTRGVPLSVAMEPWRGERSVYRWLQEDPDAAEVIRKARALGFDYIAHECLEIADDARNDWMERHGSDGEFVGWQFNTESFQRSKLRIETRLRLLRAWDPSRYGEQTSVKVEADIHTTQTTRHVVDVRALDEQGRTALRALIEQARAQGLIEGPGEPEPIETSYVIRAGLDDAPDTDDDDEA